MPQLSQAACMKAWMEAREASSWQLQRQRQRQRQRRQQRRQRRQQLSITHHVSARCQAGAAAAAPYQYGRSSATRMVKHRS